MAGLYVKLNRKVRRCIIFAAVKRFFLFFAGILLCINCARAGAHTGMGDPVVNTGKTTAQKKKSNKTAQKQLGLVGKMVSVLLKGKFAKKLFAQYWNGGGNYYLSDEEAVLIATEINRLGNGYCVDSSVVAGAGSNAMLKRKLYNFYTSAPLVDAIGYGTVYFNGNLMAGFYDDYDFNPKPKGVRPFIHELKTRLMHFMGKIRGAKAFEIYYGEVPGK